MSIFRVDRNRRELRMLVWLACGIFLERIHISE